MINFKANYISDATIKRRAQDNNFKNYKVSFVEFDPNNKEDVLAVKYASQGWDNDETYARSIFNDIQEDHYIGNTLSRYVGITRQRNDFKNPLADDILALAEVRKVSNNRNELLYFQVDPAQNMFACEALFKGIGTAVLDSIKTLFKGKEIILQPVESAINFYKANKFLNLEFSSKLIWRP